METPGETEEVAPPGTWVLRGGALPAASGRKNLRDVHEAYGIWGICVSADPGSSVVEGVAKVPFGTRKISYALTEELSEGGWLVVREPGREWPNALLTFPNGEPDSEEWDRLRTVLTEREMISNPHYKGA